MVIFSASSMSNEEEATTISSPGCQDIAPCASSMEVAPAAAVRASCVHVGVTGVPCKSSTPRRTPMTLAPYIGNSGVTLGMPCKVMTALCVNGAASVPTVKLEPIPRTKMYDASMVTSRASSTVSRPETRRRFRRGGDTSSRMFCPGGITTESPSAGGAAPPQVLGLLHRSMYMKVALGPSTAAPTPPSEGTVTESVEGETCAARRPAVQTIIDPVVSPASTAQTTPSMVTEALAPSPAPLSVTDVPPAVVPSAGSTDITEGVADRAYVKLPPAPTTEANTARTAA
mmetsp:Transcript_37964/g.94098  ORF Transcript_37964/g.94098 Transcript_37964/m.94098 type:complete len:286 (+) Transcript_37964:3623-4480(+)